MHRILPALLVALTALAGCSEDPQEQVPDEFDGRGPDLVATDDTGILRGVVVDATVTPVGGVTISLTDGASTQSDAEGLFGFDGLEPGTHFFTAGKPGFFEVQSSAEVVAGEERPPIVRVQLERDEAFNPYSSTLQYTGFYQCGTSFLVVCGAPKIVAEELLGQEDPLGIDTSTNTFYFDKDLQFLQVEMVWESTQALSPELTFQVEALDDGCRPLEGLGGAEMGRGGGPSPLRARVDNATLEHYQVNPVDCGAYLSVFAGGAQGTPAGFSIEQRFDWFITAFYGYEPPEDWWFIHDGPVTPPS